MLRGLGLSEKLSEIGIALFCYSQLIIDCHVKKLSRVACYDWSGIAKQCYSRFTLVFLLSYCFWLRDSLVLFAIMAFILKSWVSTNFVSRKHNWIQIHLTSRFYHVNWQYKEIQVANLREIDENMRCPIFLLI